MGTKPWRKFSLIGANKSLMTSLPPEEYVRDSKEILYFFQLTSLVMNLFMSEFSSTNAIATNTILAHLIEMRS